VAIARGRPERRAEAKAMNPAVLRGVLDKKATVKPLSGIQGVFLWPAAAPQTGTESVACSEKCRHNQESTPENVGMPGKGRPPP